MLEVAALTVLVLLTWGAVTVAFVALKAVLWLLVLPLRFLFLVVLLPLFAVKAVIGGVLLAVVAPLLAIAAVVGVVGFASAVAVPVLPLLLIGLAVWMVVRVSRAAVSPTTA